MHYIQQEREEKDKIRHSPKNLTSSAVNQYQQGNLDAALETFRQAFTIMPKNASIALNLLQAAAISIRDKEQTKYDKEMVRNCMITIENGALSAEQDQRYHKVKEILQELD